MTSRSTLERTWCQGLDDGSASDGTKDLDNRQNRGSHGTQRADKEHAEPDRGGEGEPQLPTMAAVSWDARIGRLT